MLNTCRLMDLLVAEMIPRRRGEEEQGPEHALTRSQDGKVMVRDNCVVSHNLGNDSWLVAY